MKILKRSHRLISIQHQRISFRTGFLIFIFTFLFPQLSQAQPFDYGIAPNGQPGILRIHSAIPTERNVWMVSSHIRYGFQPSAIVEDDRYHFAQTQIALDYAPLSFLQISLAADHVIAGYYIQDVSGEESLGGIGDLTFSLGGRYSITGSVSLGAQCNVFFLAGRGAFNVSGQSISPSILFLMTYHAENLPLALHFNVSYNHDRSAHLLGDPPLALTQEQILLSGATDVAHQIGLGLAFEYQIRRFAPFLELSALLLPTGEDFGFSPFLIGFGFRAWVGPSDMVQLSLATEFRATPSPQAPDPTTGRSEPFPLFFNVMAGLAIRLGNVDDDEDEDEDPIEVEPITGRFSGRVLCSGGSCGMGTTVSIDGTGSSPLAPDSQTGTFTSPELPVGSYTVIADAPSYEEGSQTVQVTAAGTGSIEFDLEMSPGAIPIGIRGRIVGIRTRPIQDALVRIPSLDAELRTDEDGQFLIHTQPGQYDIIITARGYRTYHNRITVTSNGIVVMNVEMTPRRVR